MTSQDPARRALGLRVRTEREVKGLSIREAARLAGIDRATWTGVEEATRTPLPHKAAQMEQVLGWARGSFDRVLVGGEPAALDPEPVAQVDPLRDLLLEAYDVDCQLYGQDEADRRLDRRIREINDARDRRKSRTPDRPDT